MRSARAGSRGTVLVHKVAGAAAEAGLSLAEVKAEAEAAGAALFSMGLGLGACIVPAAGKRGFELGEDEVEYGLGIHGESGARRGPIAPADAMLDQLVDRLIARGGIAGADRVALLVNNLGGTAVQELSIVARHALLRLEKAGVRAEAALAGSFLTALEMPGVSVSLLKLDDLRLARLLAPSAAGAWVPPTRPAASLEAVVVPDEAVDARALGRAWSVAGHERRFADAIAAVAAALRQDEARLTELDSVVGDGDIGISLSRGARAVEDLAPRLDMDRPAAALRDVSANLRRHLGGTSGPLYAVFVLRAATSLAEAPDPSAAAAWAAAFRAGTDGIQALGRRQGRRPDDARRAPPRRRRDRAGRGSRRGMPPRSCAPRSRRRRRASRPPRRCAPGSAARPTSANACWGIPIPEPMRWRCG
ncbi:MAG: dihydroxyacetone kinase subunit DhaK [Sphingomonas sp.]